MMKKNKKMTILIALLLTVSMLTGCGGNAAETTPAENQGTAGAQTASVGKEAEETAEAVSGEPASYRAQYLQLADATLTAGLDHASAAGDTIYFTSLGGDRRRDAGRCHPGMAGTVLDLRSGSVQGRH